MQSEHVISIAVLQMEHLGALVSPSVSSNTVDGDILLASEAIVSWVSAERMRCIKVGTNGDTHIWILINVV